MERPDEEAITSALACTSESRRVYVMAERVQDFSSNARGAQVVFPSTVSKWCTLLCARAESRKRLSQRMSDSSLVAMEARLYRGT